MAFFKSNKKKAKTKRLRFFSTGNSNRRFGANAVTQKTSVSDADDHDAEDVGFPSDDDISLEDLHYFYNRDPQGNRIIQKYSSDPFKKGVEIITKNDNFRKEAEDFNSYFLPALEDILRGALLDGYCLGYKNFNDGAEISKEVMNARPFSDDKIIDFSFIRENQIKKWNRNLDPTSEMHNQIESYIIKVKEKESDTWDEKEIHNSRIIHIDFESLPGDKKGQPLLLRSYNLFLFKTNFEWGMSEGFWRNGAPLNVLHMPWDADDEEYDRGRDVLSTVNAQTHIQVPTGKEGEGYKFEQFGGNLTDPKSYAEYIERFISSLPETIILGTVAGAVTGSELNMKLYYDDIRNLQLKILKPIIEDQFWQNKKLGLWKSFDEDFKIEFPPLEEMTEDEIAEIEKNKAGAAALLLGSEKQGRPPLMMPAEIRKLLWPEMDEAEPELKKIWEEHYNPEKPEEEQPEEQPFPPFGVQKIVNRLSDGERQQLEDKWLYPQDMNELKMYSKLLPIFSQDIEEFKEKVTDAYKQLYTPGVSSQKSDSESTYYINQPSPEAIEEFVKRILKIKFNNKEMADVMTNGGEEVFEDSVEFTFMALDIDGYPVGSQRTADILKQRAGMHSWKFYEDVSQKVKWEMAEGVSKGEGIVKLKKRLDDISLRKDNDLKKMVRTVVKEAALDAKMEVYKELGVEYVIFLATMDERTCEECMGYDGTVLTRDEFRGMMLIHIACRCDSIPETTRPGGW